jgi:hypothetical protein
MTTQTSHPDFFHSMGGQMLMLVIAAAIVIGLAAKFVF